ncbi:MAG: type II secretion system F family protein [Mollicutes bacterium]|nr:type II secretion system F family protein [Mollicutes bacterium]
MKKSILINKVYRKSTIENTKRKIIALGSDNKININTFLNVKTVLLVLTFFTLLLFSHQGYLMAPVFSFIVYYLYDYIILDLKIKKRSKLLEKEAVFYFKVLALTIEHEKNLKTCFEITSKAIDSNISREIQISLEELKYGKSLIEALNDTKKRIPSKEVNNVLFNIIESNKYGNSIVDLLNNQIEYLTDKRILSIKAQINRLPTKISIISVIFFIPLILLLILGPVLIRYFINF